MLIADIFSPIQAYNAEITSMSPAPDNLASLKDDMIAFIEGHGMRRFHGYVDYEEVQSVIWKTEDNPDSWKDFVELAKAAAAPFLTMDSWTLRREELDQLVERLAKPNSPTTKTWKRRAGCAPMSARPALSNSALPTRAS